MRWKGLPYLCIFSHRHYDGGMELLNLEFCICVFLELHVLLLVVCSVYSNTRRLEMSPSYRGRCCSVSWRAAEWWARTTVRIVIMQVRASTPSRKALQRARDLARHCKKEYCCLQRFAKVNIVKGWKIFSLSSHYVCMNFIFLPTRRLPMTNFCVTVNVNTLSLVWIIYQIACPLFKLWNSASHSCTSTSFCLLW
jgi:hypothetical protein